MICSVVFGEVGKTEGVTHTIADFTQLAKCITFHCTTEKIFGKADLLTEVTKI